MRVRSHLVRTSLFAIKLEVKALIARLRGFTHGPAAVSGRIFHRIARSASLRTRTNQFVARRTGGVGWQTSTPASDHGSQGAQETIQDAATDRVSGGCDGAVGLASGAGQRWSGKSAQRADSLHTRFAVATAAGAARRTNAPGDRLRRAARPLSILRPHRGRVPTRTARRGPMEPAARAAPSHVRRQLRWRTGDPAAHRRALMA